MPRKAKEKIDEIEDKSKKNVVKKTTAKAGSEKKNSAKAVSTKKTTSRKSTLAKIIEEIAADPVEVKKSTKVKSADKSENKSTKTKSASSPEKKSTKTKSAGKSKKETPKKTSTKKETKKETTKATTKKSPTKKTATTKTKRTTTNKASNKNKKTVQVLEYYDLPYKYGNTVVRLLAQTPKTLFVYWEVSDSDIDNFKKTYGDDFFNKTKPILIVHNLTLNKTTEIEINDFANCWYLNTDDTDCKFDIELARKYIDNNK